MRASQVLLIALAVTNLPSASRCESNAFLSQSNLLRSEGVELSPAQLRRGNIVLPVLKPGVAAPMTFLSSKGNVPLTRLRGARKRRLDVHTCGGDEYAAPWRAARPIRGSGYFVASGAGVRSLKIDWHEAVPVNAELPQSCSSARDLTNTEVRIATTEDRSQLMFAATLLTAQTIRWRELYARLGDKAYQSRGNPAYFCDAEGTDFSGLQRAGLVVGGRCDVLVEQNVDCDGRGAEGAFFVEPRGVLTISKGDVRERWLVYQAEGYEGDAFIGLRVSDIRPLPKSDVEVYVYSGC